MKALDTLLPLLAAIGERETVETLQLIELVAAAAITGNPHPADGGITVDLYPDRLPALVGRITRTQLPDGGWRITVKDA